jgi:ornithine cyclodeaminase
MGGLWATRGVAGIKSYPTVDGRFSFVINLFDLIRNEPTAVIVGDEVTRFRTAAITALVASKAARPEARTVCLIGAGFQGRSIAQALTETFDLERILVVDPGLDSQRFNALRAELSVPVQQSDAETAVRAADIVVTATRSKSPVFSGEWLRPGAFVAAIGTSLPNGREIDDITLRRAGRVLVEWKQQSLSEAGEVVMGLASGALDAGKVFDLAELYRAETPWRDTASEIVVFKSVGTGLADVATSWLALQRLNARKHAGQTQP